MVGGFGFWFCGIFGGKFRKLAASSCYWLCCSTNDRSLSVFAVWRQTSIQDPELYQKWGTAFSTFWGSWAFLIGSYIQLWEGINKRS